MPKRILFMIPHVPYPPHQGGAMRSFGLISGLARRGHRVGLLTFREEGQAPIEQTPLAAMCDPAAAIPAPPRNTGARLRDLLAGQTDMARRFWSEAYRDALDGMLAENKFDAIQLAIEMVSYLPVIERAAPHALLVYDALNAEYDLQKRIAQRDLQSPARWLLAAYSLIQTVRLRRVETDLCRRVSHILACSAADAHTLAALSHSTPISVIPNAISVKDYQTGNVSQAEIPHPALVFTGKMDFRPNVDAMLWFADEVLPRIRNSVAAAHLSIVGQKPHARLDGLRGRPDITLTGFVPEVKPYLAAADVYVAPLRMGSGTRFKLLEAMAMGKAIVSTHLGAEGLAVENGREMLLADTAGGFAEAVIELLSDGSRRRVLGDNAARLVAEKYDWEVIVPKAEAVYAT